MKKILLSCLAFLAIVLFLFLLPLFFPTPETAKTTSNLGLPWQIERDETGQTRVFGLSPGVSTLNDAVARLGENMELAIMIAANTPRGEEAKDAALEAYYNQVVLNFIQARLILTLNAPPDMVVSMLSRSPDGEYMKNGSRKFLLRSEDAKLAATLPLAAITLVPNARLDAETVTLRFGPPTTVISVGEASRHYLYPDKGLDIVFDGEGKRVLVLQYVAPADFGQRILRPLEAGSVKSAEKPPTA